MATTTEVRINSNREILFLTVFQRPYFCATGSMSFANGLLW